MLKIGCHQSIARGYKAMALEAEKLGATSLAFFTRNPRGGKAKALDFKDLQGFLEEEKKLGLFPLVAHAPYTYNLASNKDYVRAFAKEAMLEDLRRLENLPAGYYNLHPGSHVGQGVDRGIELIIQALKEVLKESFSTTILLETMAGKGSEIGRSFEELRDIIQGLGNPAGLAITLDTCHVYDAGYDIKNDLIGVFHDFDKHLGLDKLKALHLNDSKNLLGSRRDRHEKLGQGSLGLETFKSLVNHTSLRKLPMILETPQDLEGYREEILLVRSLASD